MKIQKPTNSESTFSSNKQVKDYAGFTDVKRDGTVKDISIALYDVDYAIKWHLENVIKPTVIEENSVITVPVLFAAGEKWATVQKHGYLRDNQGKLLTPLIMIKRNSVTKRDDIQDLKVLETPDARITFERKYTKQNRYDRFALTKSIPNKEYYSVDVPKFVQIDYDLLVWTNNTIQLNEVVEQLIWFDGKAFGDAHKFITHIDAPSFESVNSTGEDRIVRASMAMRTKAHILNTHGPFAPAMYKLNPINKVVIGIEVDGTSEQLGAVAGMQSVSVAPTSLPRASRSANNVAINSALVYVNANKQLIGTVVDSVTVTFASGWLSAPSPLAATSVSNFIFYVNGALIEPTAIVSFSESNNVSTLVINSTELSYTLDSLDEIVAIGKFK